MTQAEQSINLVRIEDVKFFVDLLMQIDADAYQILRQATIPNDINSDNSYDCLPESAMLNALEVLGSHYSKEELGVIFWEGIRNSYMPTFVSQLSEHDSVLDACHELTELVKISSPNSKVYPTFTAGSWWLVREKLGQKESWYEDAEVFSVLFMVEFIRSITQATWKPEQISLVSDHSDLYTSLPTLHNVTFIHQRSATAIKIPEAVMERVPSFYKSSAVSNSVKPILFSEPTFMDTFRLAISPYLSMGKLPVKLAAEILRMNVRTLQRRLEKEGLVYKALIEDMTFELIIEAMKTSQESITTIANRFGYSDAAHFTRAFKRRYNQTPRAFRKSLTNEPE
ncbi:hypothetical protein BCS96_00225 [Vibrio breoganii]|uniref:helix-turn-helix domain-containing protein n=1 Tax=Vibrio breoganii TaxID=553239 RepID=UPI0002E05E0D|nr:helix-turn-helix transcriptional regulator [Vibrio breoganii]MDN3715114.1 helix-turn-helix transcriptional regulator [Vibrio breoganii]OED92346.1 hypothetical protein A1QE_06225 [Vibrio breoganii ZF-55]OED93894.1 hypothetical protein A1QG_03830 [Vibrio breoganii ZF-29]OEF81744.1 hypothetical protein B003_02335 [Vibrio breoganii 1C10]PMG00784.1 hypothetical protein BCV02_02605 [Vibrio breoganii]